MVVSVEMAQFLAQISRDIRRQIGVLLDRRGRVQHVIVGDSQRLMIPDLGRHRAGRARLRGVRLIHTHVLGEPLSRDDLTDLSLLQLDLMGVVQVDDTGRATTLEIAHLVPPGLDDQLWALAEPEPIGQSNLHFLQFIDELESQLAVFGRRPVAPGMETRAIAVHLATGAPDEPEPERSLLELHELARTAKVEIVETVIQRRGRPDPRFVIGRGKLDELVLASMQQSVDLIIFDRELTPAQVRSIADAVEIRVIDRTQLILDIFAQRAETRDGKLQVELAQLKYMLPRLAGRNTAMSRLTGGIGGRGPGEKKLEIDRRRAKDRIHRLSRQIDTLSKQRLQRRRRRRRSGIPVASIIGYTNAGKSTLLNALTGAKVLAEDALFATLDPTTRRVRFPNELELVLTDTVGFIRDLPEDLVTAFKATLEELHEADVLIHTIDIATSGWDKRIQAVERILDDLGLSETPRILVFNKADKVADKEVLGNLGDFHDAVSVCALDAKTLEPLTDRLCRQLLDGRLERVAHKEAPGVLPDFAGTGD